MVQRSGDRQGKAKRKAAELQVNPDDIKDYPMDSLVVDPYHDKFNPDQRIEIKQFIEVSHGQGVVMVCVGGAVYEETKKHTIHQIVLMRKNPIREYARQYAVLDAKNDPHYSDQRYEYYQKVEPGFIDGNEIGLALDVMKEQILDEVLPQIPPIVARDMYEWGMKINQMGKELAGPIPWFFEKKSMITTVSELDIMSGKFKH